MTSSNPDGVYLQLFDSKKAARLPFRPPLVKIALSSANIYFIYEALPSADRQPRIVMEVGEKSWTYPEMQELAQILNLVSGRKHYPLTYLTVEHEEYRRYERLIVETRSLKGILFFLSQLVDVPTRHVREGKVTTTRNEIGQTLTADTIGGCTYSKAINWKILQSTQTNQFR
jgi:hypothetical protein